MIAHIGEFPVDAVLDVVEIRDDLDRDIEPALQQVQQPERDDVLVFRRHDGHRLSSDINLGAIAMVVRPNSARTFVGAPMTLGQTNSRWSRS